MFVGHGLLAFALAAWLAHSRGWPRQRSLTVGLLAALFGTAPDVDMLYVPLVLLERATVSPSTFWGVSTIAHRTVTHSLLIAAGLVLAVGAWSIASKQPSTDRHNNGLRLASIAVCTVLVVIAVGVSGPLMAALLALFAVTTLAIGTAGARLGLDPLVVTGAAGIGLFTHPFGDLVTGTPPPLCYPLDVVVVADVVRLHPDPTIHLLAAFAVELSTAWLALLVWLRVDGRGIPDWRQYVAGRGGLGIGYAAAAPVLPAPTLDESYQFVFSVLVLGIVLGVATRDAWRQPLGVLVTGLVTVTLAWAAYGVVYVSLL